MKRPKQPRHTDTNRGHPSSREAESITIGDLILGSPAGGTTRRWPLYVRLLVWTTC